MTDEEITDIIATKIMGWHLEDHPEKNGTGQWFSEYEYQQWFNADGEMVADHNFNPPNSNEDCMLAARCISETHTITLVVTFSPQDNLNACRAYSNIGARTYSPKEIIDHLKHETLMANCQDESVLRAMCLCMVRAVE